MIADQNFYDVCFAFFNPTASATAKGQRLKFSRAEHSATAEGENCAYGPTLASTFLVKYLDVPGKIFVITLVILPCHFKNAVQSVSLVC